MKRLRLLQGGQHLAGGGGVVPVSVQLRNYSFLMSNKTPTVGFMLLSLGQVLLNSGGVHSARTTPTDALWFAYRDAAWIGTMFREPVDAQSALAFGIPGGRGYAVNDNDNELRGCRVLIAEDEYFLANDLEQTFKSHGAKIVGPVSDFDTALRLAERDHFDVAILDLELHDELASPLQTSWSAIEYHLSFIPDMTATSFQNALLTCRCGRSRSIRANCLRILIGCVGR